MNLFQKLTALGLVAFATISILEARSAWRLEAERQVLNRQKGYLAELVQQLTRERDKNAGALTTLREQRNQERRSFPNCSAIYFPSSLETPFKSVKSATAVNTRTHSLTWPWVMPKSNPITSCVG